MKQQGNLHLEKIEPNIGSSFTYSLFEKSETKTAPFWHFHPEIEIVYIEKGNGKRHVGNHISYFHRGDLILLGPNLPHFGFIDRLTNHSSEVVVQLREHFMGEHFFDLPEMAHIKALLERSAGGISFNGNIKKQVGERLSDMNHMTPFERLTTLLRVLDLLAKAENYDVLNAQGVSLVVNNQDSERANHIYHYVRTHFLEEIPLHDIASEVNMTIPAFCRYFKKNTQKTFTQFVNHFRIVHACKLLHEETHTITDVCFDCGFNNFSHFNRYFKKVTGKTPSAYRKELTASYVSF